MRLVFAGTPQFAADILDGLLQAGHDVAAVYAQPDRRAGRGRRVEQGPVKRLAQAHGLSAVQPESLRGAAEQAALAVFRADLMVVAAYGLILPPAVLETPRLGCINVHASLLPRWRGAAPVARAIEAGDTLTGVCIMQMEATLDTGPVLEYLECPIEPGDTTGVLTRRLAALGVQALGRALAGIAAGTASASPQDHEHATYAARLEKSEARIRWSDPAAQIERRVRAFDPWPVAYCEWRHRSESERLRIWESHVSDGASQAPPGTVVHATRDGIEVATGAGTLAITRLQPPGRRPQTASDFLNAHPAVAGAVLE